MAFFSNEQKKLAYQNSFDELVSGYKSASKLVKILSKDFDDKDFVVNKDLDYFQNLKTDYEKALLFRKSKQFKRAYPFLIKKYPFYGNKF